MIGPAFGPGLSGKEEMKIRDLFPKNLLDREIANGFVRVNKHPFLPLRIFNYTEKTQFDRRWNPVTMTCRGLIVDDEDNIVARPFKKFFNYEEMSQILSLDEPVITTDKMDGSLGILYPTGYVNGVHGGRQHAIATRGSFTSDQAKHANSVWQSRYHGRVDVVEGWTLLFEIVYPDNRIVVDYNGLDDLVLLGAVDIESGEVVSPELVREWPGPRTQTFDYMTLGEAVSAPPRPGNEGMVIRSLMDGTMVKLKQTDYVELHKIVTGLNEKVIWERLSERRDPLEGIPDEWHSWVSNVAESLWQAHMELRVTAWEEWVKVRHLVANRRAFAMAIKDLTPWIKTVMFLWADGKDAYSFLWKQIKPRGDKPNA